MSNLIEMPFTQPAKDPVATFEDVTPAMAESFLLENEGNRRLSSPKIDRYAGQMERGTFMGLNGESASIDWNGKIHNGQHRFSAIVKSGVAVRMLVVRGVDPATFTTVDDVSKRTAADAFTIEGFSSSQSRALPIAAALEIAMRLGTKKFHVPSYIGYLTTPTETMKLVESDGTFVDTLKSLKGIVKARRDLLPLGAATFLIRRMRLKEVEIGSIGFTDEWMPNLFTGMHLSMEPRFIVREIVAQADASRVHATYSVADRMAMITKAWWSDLSKNPQKTKTAYTPPIKDATKWLELDGDELDGLHKIRMSIKR